jgi:Ca2+:H+ antiporter
MTAMNTVSPTSSVARRVSYAPHLAPQSAQSQTQYTPLLESVDLAIKSTGALPSTMSTDDFTRAVAVATVSALRHQHAHTRAARASVIEDEHAAAHGHEAPEWSRMTSAGVLLACTALYAIIAGSSRFSFAFFVRVLIVWDTRTPRDSSRCGAAKLWD